MAKGVAHAGKGKSLSSGEACENERRGWNEDSYRRKNEKEWNNYDWSRHHLNFEIKDGKIIPLGSQAVSLYDRYLNVLKDIGFKEYKAGATNQQHTYIELILSGSSEKMQKIAFGDQEVNFERNPDQWKNWNIKRTTGYGSIEEWALDVYKFVCKKFGKENIIGFEVHLDETGPHVHVNIVPTAIKQQRGNISGYHKIEMVDGKPKLDDEGNTIPAVYTKGKHIGEMIKISDKKYNDLSDEKKQEYRKNIRGTVRTISYSTYFGDKLSERSEKLSELHDDFYKEIGAKWGFERGDVWALLPPEEQQGKKHLTKQEAWKLKKAELARKAAEEKAAIAERRMVKSVDAIQAQEKKWRENAAELKKQEEAISINEAVMEENNEEIKAQENKIASINEQIKDKNVELQDVSNEIEQAVYDKNKAVSEKNEVQKELDIMRSASTVPCQSVDRYVSSLGDIKFTVPKEIRAKLKSNLRNHPRITCQNPPLTIAELDRIVDEELDKVKHNSSLITSKSSITNQIRDIFTDRQTIEFSVVDPAQKKGIAQANKELYKDIKKQLADNTTKTMEYDKMKRAGITPSSYEKVVKERDEAIKSSQRTSETEKAMEYFCPEIIKAKDVLIDPELDNVTMSNEQKRTFLDALDKDPQKRLKDLDKLLDYAGSFRDISLGTKLETIYIATENIIHALENKGFDLMKEATDTPSLASLSNELGLELSYTAGAVASAAACLICGYLDGALTVSSACGGGGGGNNDLPRKKDDEDDRRFFGRCLQVAMAMMAPKQKRSRGFSR